MSTGALTEDPSKRKRKSKNMIKTKYKDSDTVMSIFSGKPYSETYDPDTGFGIKEDLTDPSKVKYVGIKETDRTASKYGKEIERRNNLSASKRDVYSARPEIKRYSDLLAEGPEEEKTKVIDVKVKRDGREMKRIEDLLKDFEEAVDDADSENEKWKVNFVEFYGDFDKRTNAFSFETADENIKALRTLLKEIENSVGSNESEFEENYETEKDFLDRAHQKFVNSHEEIEETGFFLSGLEKYESEISALKEKVTASERKRRVQTESLRVFENYLKNAIKEIYDRLDAFETSETETKNDYSKKIQIALDALQSGFGKPFFKESYESFLFAPESDDAFAEAKVVVTRIAENLKENGNVFEATDALSKALEKYERVGYAKTLKKRLEFLSVAEKMMTNVADFEMTSKNYEKVRKAISEIEIETRNSDLVYLRVEFEPVFTVVEKTKKVSISPDPIAKAREVLSGILFSGKTAKEMMEDASYYDLVRSFGDNLKLPAIFSNISVLWTRMVHGFDGREKELVKLYRDFKSLLKRSTKSTKNKESIFVVNKVLYNVNSFEKKRTDLIKTGISAIKNVNVFSVPDSYWNDANWGLVYFLNFYENWMTELSDALNWEDAYSKYEKLLSKNETKKEAQKEITDIVNGTTEIIERTRKNIDEFETSSFPEKLKKEVSDRKENWLSSIKKDEGDLEEISDAISKLDPRSETDRTKYTNLVKALTTVERKSANLDYAVRFEKENVEKWKVNIKDTEPIASESVSSVETEKKERTTEVQKSIEELKKYVFNSSTIKRKNNGPKFAPRMETKKAIVSYTEDQKAAAYDLVHMVTNEVTLKYDVLNYLDRQKTPQGVILAEDAREKLSERTKSTLAQLKTKEKANAFQELVSSTLESETKTIFSAINFDDDEEEIDEAAFEKLSALNVYRKSALSRAKTQSERFFGFAGGPSLKKVLDSLEGSVSAFYSSAVELDSVSAKNACAGVLSVTRFLMETISEPLVRTLDLPIIEKAYPKDTFAGLYRYRNDQFSNDVVQFLGGIHGAFSEALNFMDGKKFNGEDFSAVINGVYNAWPAHLSDTKPFELSNGKPWRETAESIFRDSLHVARSKEYARFAVKSVTCLSYQLAMYQNLDDQSKIPRHGSVDSVSLLKEILEETMADLKKSLKYYDDEDYGTDFSERVVRLSEKIRPEDSVICYERIDRFRNEKKKLFEWVDVFSEKRKNEITDWKDTGSFEFSKDYITSWINDLNEQETSYVASARDLMRDCLGPIEAPWDVVRDVELVDPKAASVFLKNLLVKFSLLCYAYGNRGPNFTWIKKEKEFFFSLAKTYEKAILIKNENGDEKPRNIKLEIAPYLNATTLWSYDLYDYVSKEHQKIYGEKIENETNFETEATKFAELTKTLDELSKLGAWDAKNEIDRSELKNFSIPLSPDNYSDGLNGDDYVKMIKVTFNDLIESADTIRNFATNQNGVSIGSLYDSMRVIFNFFEATAGREMHPSEYLRLSYSGYLEEYDKTWKETVAGAFGRLNKSWDEGAKERIKGIAPNSTSLDEEEIDELKEKVDEASFLFAALAQTTSPVLLAKRAYLPGLYSLKERATLKEKIKTSRRIADRLFRF